MNIFRNDTLSGAIYRNLRVCVKSDYIRFFKANFIVINNLYQFEIKGHYHSISLSH